MAGAVGEYSSAPSVGQRPELEPSIPHILLSSPVPLSPLGAPLPPPVSPGPKNNPPVIPPSPSRVYPESSGDAQSMSVMNERSIASTACCCRESCRDEKASGEFPKRGHPLFCWTYEGLGLSGVGVSDVGVGDCRIIGITKGWFSKAQSTDEGDKEVPISCEGNEGNCDCSP